ncbi:MAG TPA: hypothetical protein VIA18_26085, partial [Polyangia bacterium]|nr:hypothetical protein [Polyangia bacterium]
MRADASSTRFRSNPTLGFTLSAAFVLGAAFSLVGAGCSGSVGSDEPGSAGTLSAASSYKVNFKTAVVGDYVTAENGGGGTVNANRTVASTWETFTLYDLNGGALADGDQIEIAALNGDFVSAENGGGGAVNANRTVALDWETFTIHRTAGAGTINNGDQISLQTKTLGEYVSAANGGGAGVTADRTVASGWETFALEILSGGGTAGGGGTSGGGGGGGAAGGGGGTAGGGG